MLQHSVTGAVLHIGGADGHVLRTLGSGGLCLDDATLLSALKPTATESLRFGALQRDAVQAALGTGDYPTVFYSPSAPKAGELQSLARAHEGVRLCAVLTDHQSLDVLRSAWSCEFLLIRPEGLYLTAVRSNSPDARTWNQYTGDGRLLAWSQDRLRMQRRGCHTLGLPASPKAVEVSGPSYAETELARVRGSTSYRLGAEIINAPRQGLGGAVGLPKRVLDIFRKRSPAVLPARTVKVDLEPATKKNRAELVRRFEAFLDNVRASKAERFVFMFSGTTYIQELRANRPIRLTRVMLEQDVPVFFSYHGLLSADLPADDNPNLFQCPVEHTETLLGAIAELDLGAKKKLMVVAYPHPMIPRTLGQFTSNNWSTIYDCRDEWEAFHNVGQASWYSGPVERFVVNHCDETFCVSGSLVEKMRSYSGGNPVALSANALDIGFERRVKEPVSVDRVTIGYFGHLSAAWFDWESLAEIARRTPEYRYEIIGHLGPSTVDIPENIHLLGPKLHAEICEIARSWSVGIIPFRVGPLSDGVDPIKIYEYFALQLPVVSFRMPQIDEYVHTRTVVTVDDFVVALEDAVKTPHSPQEFLDFLKGNRWQDRVAQFFDSADRHQASRLSFERGQS